MLLLVAVVLLLGALVVGNVCTSCGDVLPLVIDGEGARGGRSNEADGARSNGRGMADARSNADSAARRNSKLAPSEGADAGGGGAASILPMVVDGGDGAVAVA